MKCSATQYIRVTAKRDLKGSLTLFFSISRVKLPAFNSELVISCIFVYMSEEIVLIGEIFKLFDIEDLDSLSESQLCNGYI